MIPANVKVLIEQGDVLFSQRQTLDSLWQDIAEQFYVERADFTIQRDMGEDFADHLQSSYPIMVRRELGNAFSGMLRPTNVEWFDISIADEWVLKRAGREWLQHATHIQRKAMYDRRTMFRRATKEGDHDFATFGQCVITREIDWNKSPPALLFRNWHLRDVAWAERYDGAIAEIHRKWDDARIYDINRMFPSTIHPNMKKRVAKEGNKKVQCRVVTIEADRLHGETDNIRTPWVQLYIDVANQHILEKVGLWTSGYTIPRWQTVSGSQYAYSPATVAGLPDARLIQAITLTLLEAGEMAVRPPVIATQDAIRSDINWYPGGITFSDVEYDERKGEVLRPISQDTRNLPFGIEMQADIREMLASAFYLNKLTLPPTDHEMTAYETGQRIQEYIREALPLFEPMEVEYNGALCEDTFDALLRAGVFGPLTDIPDELRGQDIQFKFKSPLHDALERKKGTTFLETKELLREASELDSTAHLNLDVRAALRDAMHGIGVPARWMRDEDDVEEKAEELAAEQEAGEQALIAEQAGAGVKSVTEAGKALATA